MTELFRQYGFIFMFFSHEHEPIHVHVRGHNGDAKFVWDGEGFVLESSNNIKANIHIQFSPMDADCANFIFLTFHSRSFQQVLVPKQRLTIDLSIITKAIEPLALKPYFIDLHRLPFYSMQRQVSFLIPR